MRANHVVSEANKICLRVEAPLSDYREFPAPSALREHVLCLWTQTISKSHAGYFHRVLADDCIELGFVNNAPPEVVGPWTESFVAGFAAGTTILGVRFHPGRASNFLLAPANALLNQSVAIDDVSRTLHERFLRIPDETTLAGRKAALI